MTVPKTVLVVALLLAAAATAQEVSPNSLSPYYYRSNIIGSVYLLWYPPHAVPMNLMFLNVTWWKHEAIWFIGKYYEYVCCGYEPVTVYVVQDGVWMNLSRVRRPQVIADFIGWHIKNRYCAQGIAMVAPIKVIELDPTTQIWISDIYCLYNNGWFWLRLLPYIFDDLSVEGVEAVNITDKVINEGVVVYVPAKPPGNYIIPAAWYLDPVTKRVFRIPNDTAVMAELQRLRVRVYELEAELANKTALLNAMAALLNLTIAQLNASLAAARGEAARLSAENQRLKAQLEELNYTRTQLEREAAAYRSQLEALRASVAAQLAQLTAENQALKAQISSMNEALAKLKEAYASQTAQLEAWTRAAWIGAALGAAAGAAVTTLVFRRRK